MFTSKSITFVRGKLNPEALRQMEEYTKQTGQPWPVPLPDEAEILHGTLFALQHPFGLHFIASLYGGEKIITLQASGGHQATTGLLTIQRCDTPLEIINLDGGSNHMIASFLHYLPENVQYQFIVMAGLITFTEDTWRKALKDIMELQSTPPIVLLDSDALSFREIKQ